jgi:hypothetical protein
VIAGREIMERLTEIEASCGLRGSRQAVVSHMFDLKEVHRRSAAITARYLHRPILQCICAWSLFICVCRMAELEQSTRALESDMAETWYAAQAASMMVRNTSSHPSQNIGVYFLCVDDMAWVPQVMTHWHPPTTATPAAVCGYHVTWVCVCRCIPRSRGYSQAAACTSQLWLWATFCL